MIIRCIVTKTEDIMSREDIKDEFADLIKKQEVNTMKKQYVLSYEQGE